MSEESGKSFLRSVASIGAGTIVTTLLGAMTVPLLTRVVDPVYYGQNSLFVTYSSIAVMVLCAGQDQSIMRFWITCESDDGKAGLARFCLTVCSLVTVIAAIAALILYGWGFTLGFPWHIWMLLIVCVYAQIVSRLNYILLRVQMRSGLFSVLNVLYRVLYLCLALIFLNLPLGDDQFVALAGATTLSYVLLAFAGTLLLHSVWFRGTALLPGSPSRREIMNYGLPFTLSIGLSTLFEAVGKQSVNDCLGYYEVGVFAGAMSIINVFLIIQTTFNTVWAPEVVKRYERDPEDHTFYIKGHRCVSAALFLFGILLILFKDVIVLYLGSDYSGAAQLLPCLIIVPIMSTASESTIIGITFSKKSYLHIVTAAFALAVNIGACAELIPMLGLKGAAIAVALAYLFYFSIKTLLSWYCYRVKYGLGRFYLMTTFVMIYALSQTFFTSVALNIGLFLICLVVLVLLYGGSLKEFVMPVLSQLASVSNSVTRRRP